MLAEEQKEQEGSDKEPREATVPSPAESLPICQLLEILPRQLFARSNTHAEQLLQLLTVITTVIPQGQEEKVVVPTIPRNLLGNLVSVLTRPDATHAAADKTTSMLIHYC